MKRHLFLFFLLLAHFQLLAQQRQITGKVKDTIGIGIPGINILEKGTNNSTATDIDGDYSIKVKENAILIFSQVGYKIKEITLNTQNILDIVIEDDIQSFDYDINTRKETRYVKSKDLDLNTSPQEKITITAKSYCKKYEIKKI